MIYEIYLDQLTFYVFPYILYSISIALLLWHEPVIDGHLPSIAERVLSAEGGVLLEACCIIT